LKDNNGEKERKNKVEKN